MPKAEDPQFELPIFIVQAITPGLAPLEIETQVVKPIQHEFKLLDQVKSIEAEIKSGVVSFELRFNYASDPQDSFDDMVNAVNRATSLLPKGVQFNYSKASPTEVNIYQLALTSSQDGYINLEKYAKQLQYRLESIPEINRAELWGLPEQVVQIDINLSKLAENKVSLNQVYFAIAERAKVKTAGYIESNERRYGVTLSHKVESLEHIKETIISSAPEIITVSDLANIYFTTYKPNYLSYVNGKPSVFITVQQNPEVNLFTIKEQAEALISKFKESLPPSTELIKLYDQSESVDTRINGFLDNLWFGLALILLSLFLFIGWKEAVIVSITIPISISIALFFIDLIGFSFQQMTIAGLIISLGLLVDNALVVVEATEKHLINSNSIKQSVEKALKEVGKPIIAGTFTTLFAFLPLLLLQSDTGDFMRALPASVSLVLLASLFAALFIIPALLISFNSKAKKHFNLQQVMEKLSVGIYKNSLSKLMHYPIVVITAGVALSIFFISFFPKVGVSLFPKAEKNIIVLNIETAVGSSINSTREITRDIIKQIKISPAPLHTVENIGGGNPRIYYNQINRQGESNFAQLLLLVNTENRQAINDFISNLRNKFQSYEKATVNVYEFQQGPVTDRPITIRLLGNDLTELSYYSDKIYKFLQSLEGTLEVQNASNSFLPQFSIKPNEQLLHDSSLDLTSFENAVRAALDGVRAGFLYNADGEDFSILIKPSGMNVEELFNNLFVLNKENKIVPINQVATTSVEQAAAPFFHYNKVRMMKVSADHLPDYNVQKLTEKTIKFIESLNLPDSVYYEIGGEEAARQESFGGLSQIMLIALGAIFTILVLQFNSFIQPVIIFSIIPVSITGAILGLYLTGNSFSMLAFIGMISLIGIVVNDSIIMVDSFNRNLQLGHEKRQAIVLAASHRFTPIIFTSLTTILGLLPLTLYGGELWEPMGWVIVTGLIFSTLTCLYFVPAVCLLLSFKK